MGLEMVELMVVMETVEWMVVTRVVRVLDLRDFVGNAVGLGWVVRCLG